MGNRMFKYMIKSFVLGAWLFLFFYPLNLCAQQYPNSKVDQLLKSGIDNLLEQDYQEAEQKFKRLGESYPELPLGNIYLAAIKIAQAEDMGEQFDESFINGKLDIAEKQCSKLLEKNDKDLWNNYFMALTKGYMAYYEALNKDYIAAFSDGLSSVSRFERCLKADSSFYEAYIAIGTYKYWKSEKTSFLNWMPFINNEKQLGINYLKLSMEKPSYTHYMADNSLIWIYIHEKEYQKAARIAEIALKRYPGNRFFKSALARVYQNIDKKKSIGLYTELLDSYLALKSNNHYNEIVLKHKIAMLCHDIGEDKKALRLCDEIISTGRLSEYVTDRLDDRLDRVKKLRKELQQM